MGPKEFAEACREERDALFSSFTSSSGDGAVAVQLAAANLSPSQREHVCAAIGMALTDTFYTILLALDGSASLGGIQHSFKLTDEGGETVANGDGRLEAAAWEALQAD